MPDLSVLKRQFLTYLTRERGSSDKTIENYDRYLERFLVFSKCQKPPDITLERVQAFRLHMGEQPGAKHGTRQAPMKLRTQNYYLIALRRFLTYLHEQGLETLPPGQIALFKVPEHSVDLISSTDLNRLRSAPDQKTLEGKRDKVILELLCSTGLRISELCALSIDDVDLARDEFSMRGKGDRVRVVFLSKAAKDAIRNYLNSRTDVETALFVRYGRKANDGSDPRLHARAVQRLLKKYAAAVGITCKVTPHVIRHSFAVDLLQHGADSRSVQVLLGNTSIKTIQMYSHVPDAHKKSPGK